MGFFSRFPKFRILFQSKNYKQDELLCIMQDDVWHNAMELEDEARKRDIRIFVIYPHLDQLEEAGLIQQREAVRNEAMVKSRHGRLAYEYGLTPLGLAKKKELLAKA